MLRHVSVLVFTDAATEEQRRAFFDGLAVLPELIPTIRAYSFGPDAGLSAPTGDAAVVADFDDEDGYRAYAAHPEHVRVIAELLTPILRARTAVQYEY